jgi:predicted Zn-dependent protease
MWLREGDLPTAYSRFDAARRRVPAYAPAVARLAEIDLARGEHQTAINRLRPLASSSDDPAYAAALSRALDAAGRHPEAEHHRAAASARYEQLALRHPEAYADHAADFRRDTLSHPVH